MILDECHFEFGNFQSRIHHLIFAHLDTENFRRLYSEGSTTTVYNKKNRQNYMADLDYKDGVMEFEAEIVHEDLMPLLASEQRLVERALFDKSRYEKLYVDGVDDCKDVTYDIEKNGKIKRNYLNVRFVEPERVYGDDDAVLGYKVKVICDSTMFWQDETVVKLVPTEDQTVFELDVDTDMNGYTWPTVEVVTGSVGGEIKFWNETDSDSRFTQFDNVGTNSVFKIDAAKNFVSNNHYQHFTEANFPRLMAGINKIHVLGDIKSLTYTWRNRRFM